MSHTWATWEQLFDPDPFSPVGCVYSVVAKGPPPSPLSSPLPHMPEGVVDVYGGQQTPPPEADLEAFKERGVHLTDSGALLVAPYADVEFVARVVHASTIATDDRGNFPPPQKVLFGTIFSFCFHNPMSILVNF